MVYLSSSVQEDLYDIWYGLMNWDIILTEEHIQSIIEDIYRVCYALDNKLIHFNATYNSHRRFGNKVHSYKRKNRRTNYYIIYDIDPKGNVFINKIMTNYKTISGL